MGYTTPDVGGVVGALASNWRMSGIFRARSGARVNIRTGRDNALNGISNQRPNLVGDSIYGPGKDVTDVEPGARIKHYFNPDAFAKPAPGTFGDVIRNQAVGPAFWQVDLAVSRLIPVGTQRMELRLEAFNLFNTFNWGTPEGRLSKGSRLGRIQSQAGDPRLLQLGVKYDF